MDNCTHHFEDWLTTIEVKPAVHEKLQKQKMFI